MNLEDVKSPAFEDFIVGLPVMLSDGKEHNLESMWRAFLAGWEASQTANRPKIEDDFEESPKMKTKDHVAPLSFSCARCPDPKNPDPKFHPGGKVAHIGGGIKAFQTWNPVL